LRIAELLDEIKDNLESMKDNSDDITEMMEWSNVDFQVENEDWTDWTTLFSIMQYTMYELKGAYIDIRNVPNDEDLQIRIEVDDGGGWANNCYYGETITVVGGTSPQVIPLADMTFGVAMRVQVKGDSGNYDIYYGYTKVNRE
jgi:hypothetical protein